MSKWLALPLFLLPELKISQFDRSARPMGNMWSPSHAGMGVADLADQRGAYRLIAPPEKIRGLIACTLLAFRELCSALLGLAGNRTTTYLTWPWGRLRPASVRPFSACRSRGTECLPGPRSRALVGVAQLSFRPSAGAKSLFGSSLQIHHRSPWAAIHVSATISAFQSPVFAHQPRPAASNLRRWGFGHPACHCCRIGGSQDQRRLVKSPHVTRRPPKPALLSVIQVRGRPAALGASAFPRCNPHRAGACPIDQGVARSLHDRCRPARPSRKLAGTAWALGHALAGSDVHFATRARRLCRRCSQLNFRIEFK